MLKHLFTLSLLVLLLTGCATTQSIELYPLHNAVTQIKDRYVFLIILDGPRVGDMETLVAAGKLPTIKETFFEKGARFQTGTSAFPTTSAPNHQAIMTGIFPGRNGIPALSWLDRSNKKVLTYLSPGGLKHLQSDLFNWRSLFNPKAEFTDTPNTLYNALYGQPTFNSFEQVAAGATTFQPKSLISYGAEYLIAKNYEYTDFKTAQITLRELSKTPLNKFPRLTAVAFYTLDMILHFEQPSSERVVYSYQHLDIFLKELKNLLHKKGVLHKSVFVLTGDHGFHVTVDKKLNLANFLIKEGINATNSTQFQESQAVITGRRIGSNVINLKLDPSWNQSATLDDWEKIRSKTDPTKNILEALLNHPGIALLVGPRKPGLVELRTTKGRAQIVHSRIAGEDYYQYKVPRGFADPFKASNRVLTRIYTSPILQQKQGTLFEGNDRPDSLVLASSLFEDGRSGGLVVSLSPGWNMTIKKLGTHGTFRGEDIRVPIWLSGSGIRPGTYKFARTVDIYPTLLYLMGVAFDSENIDGRVLRETLKHPPALKGTSSAKKQLAKVELSLIHNGHLKATPLSKGLRGDAQRELKRRFQIEKKLKKWKKTLAQDYGDLFNKSSAKAQKARQLKRSLDKALDKAQIDRIRMETILKSI